MWVDGKMYVGSWWVSVTSTHLSWNLLFLTEFFLEDNVFYLFGLISLSFCFGYFFYTNVHPIQDPRATQGRGLSCTVVWA